MLLIPPVLFIPNQQQENYPNQTISKTQTPRRTFKSLDDVIQNNQYGGPVKQPSYHVPPGKKSFYHSDKVSMT